MRETRVTMNRFWWRVELPALILLSVASIVASGPAAGASIGQLVGTAVDEQGRPLPGVTVSVNSPTMIGGEHVATTDDQGRFRYPRLAPGAYTVRFELDGHAIQQLTAVKVRVDRVTELGEILLSRAQFAGEIDVRATSPMIDPTQSSLGQTFTAEYLRETRSGFFGMQFHTPGIPSPSGAALGTDWQRVSGSTATDNNYYLDGAVGKRWDGSLPDATLAFLPFDAYQEAVVHTGGFEAEYGRATGGVVHMVTKSGGNSFSGSLDLRYSDSDFVTSGRHFDPDEQDSGGWNVDATFGGPILHDRLWFFTALQSFSNSETPEGAPTSFTGSGRTLFGKLTWQASPAWSVMSRFSHVPGKGEHVGSSPLTAPEATARVELEENLGLGEAVGLLSDDLLWRVGASRKSATLFDVGPQDADLRSIGHINLTTNEDYGNFVAQILSSSSRNAIESDLSWFLDGFHGQHEIELGLGYAEPELVDGFCYLGSGRRCAAGDEGFLFLDGIDAESERVPSLMLVQRTSSPVRNRADAVDLHLQDTWRLLPDLTLQLGLRWDRVVHENNLGEEIADFSKLQPRIGVAWDPVGDGRTLLRASWGRFMNVGSGLLAAATDVLSDPAEEIWLSCSTEIGIADPGVCAAVAETLGFGHRADPESWDPAGWVLLPGLVAATEPLRTAPGLRPDFTDQWILGAEREIFDRTTVELSYFHKSGKDFFESTCNGNVSEPVAGAPCDFLVVTNRPEMRSEYRAWTLRLESRARDWFHLLASWVVSEAQGSTDRNTGVTSGFDIYPVHFENRFGYLTGQSRHRAKLSGYVRLPLDFSVAVFGWWDSELRWTPLEQARLIDPSYYGTRFVERRGNRKLGSRHQIDLQLGKGFTFGTTRLKVIGTITNLLDREHPTEVCEFVTGCGNAALGEPLRWQTPRSYGLGARFEFR